MEDKSRWVLSLRKKQDCQKLKSLPAERRSTLVFAVDVAHGQSRFSSSISEADESSAEQLASAFDAAGISCKTLVGTTPTQQRLQLLQDFRDGRFQVLVNCAILTEGADVPAIDCVRERL